MSSEIKEESLPKKGKKVTISDMTKYKREYSRQYSSVGREGITEKDVWDFWNDNSFDLELPKSSGASNCDLCFLKGTKILTSLIQQKPSRVEWWAKQEAKIGARFAKDRPTYAQMGKFNDEQSQLFTDETIPCFCGD